MARGSGYGGRHAGKRTDGARSKRSALSRLVAAGGIALCIGATYEVTAPTVHALSIVFLSPDGSGHTNETRLNILQGNIFDPQLGLLGPNVSNNSTSAGGAVSTPNNPLVDNLLFNNPLTQLISAVLNVELVFGDAASGPINNATQISFFSFNIFNPQASLFGGNLSNNTASSNLAVGQGGHTNVLAAGNFGVWTGWFGGMTGNGNTMQLAFFSGNIFNPQWSLFGPNVSNNTALTNVADDNGNYSQTTVGQGGGLLGAVLHLFFGGMTGNGNTTQTAVGTSNIMNPQVSLGGSNQSNNTAVTNEAIGNGNGSQTTVGGTGSVISTGTTGNGNTSQTAIGASNIENTQVSIGDIGLTPRPAELSATQSGGQTAATGTTSASSPVSTSTSPSSSSVAAPTLTGSTVEKPVATTTGSGGTTGIATTSGSGGATGTATTSGSGGSGGSNTSGGTGGTAGS
jgi:hypothetical protein